MKLTNLAVITAIFMFTGVTANSFASDSRKPNFISEEYIESLDSNSPCARKAEGYLHYIRKFPSDTSKDNFARAAVSHSAYTYLVMMNVNYEDRCADLAIKFKNTSEHLVSTEKEKIKREVSDKSYINQVDNIVKSTSETLQISPCAVVARGYSRDMQKVLENTYIPRQAFIKAGIAYKASQHLLVMTEEQENGYDCTSLSKEFEQHYKDNLYEGKSGNWMRSEHSVIPSYSPTKTE